SVNYVTGTGANDQIFLQAGNAGAIDVTVNAFQDNAYTMPLGSFSYTIPASTLSIIVEAGLGSDDIIIDGHIRATWVDVRGGPGRAKVEVNAPSGASHFIVDGNTLTGPSSFPLMHFNDLGETGSLLITGLWRQKHAFTGSRIPSRGLFLACSAA